MIDEDKTEDIRATIDEALEIADRSEYDADPNMSRIRNCLGYIKELASGEEI